MARPWISRLLLSLVLVVIEAGDIKYKIEPCPENNVCVIFTRGTISNHKGAQGSNGRTTGFLWEAGSTSNENYKMDGFISGLWIQPITARKWKFAVTGSQGHELRNGLKFKFGSATIGFYRNETAEDNYMEVTWNKGGETFSSTHAATGHLFFTSPPDSYFQDHKGFWARTFGSRDPDNMWPYERYEFEVEYNEKLIDYFGGDVVKMIAPENSEMNDPKFNEYLHQFTSPLCDPSELRSFEFVNAVNGTIPMNKKGNGSVNCPSNLWYRNSSGVWEPIDLMRCTDGAWQGQYSPKIKVTTTVAPTEDEDDDDTVPAGLRAARSIDNKEESESADKFEYGPVEVYNLTGADVACGENPPPPDASSMSAGMKIGMTIGIIFVVLAVVTLIIAFFVLRHKRAAAGPNDTFRGGSDSKALTPKGGSMSKKSGSVVEIGGMSPAGTPNAPK